MIRSQVSRLELLLPTFNQPVMLALESDNATEVAIQRVGFFGAFDRREVTLEARQIHRDRQAQRLSRRTPRDHRGARPGRADHRDPLPRADLNEPITNGTFALPRRLDRPAHRAGRVAFRRARGVRSGFGRHALRSRRRGAARMRSRRRACARSAGRWLFDASVREPRQHQRRRRRRRAHACIAGDVITIAGSQLLVEEATPRRSRLRRFDLVGNDTLPPVGDSVRTLAPPAEDLPIDLGDMPEHRRLRARRARAWSARSRWNYAAWVMGALLVLVLGVFALLRAHRARSAARRRRREIGRQLLVAVGLERVRVAGRAPPARRARGLHPRRSRA